MHHGGCRRNGPRSYSGNKSLSASYEAYRLGILALVLQIPHSRITFVRSLPFEYLARPLKMWLENSVLGWYHMQTARTLQASGDPEAKPRFQEAADYYIQAAMSYPEDDEYHPCKYCDSGNAHVSTAYP
jgi:hypothetical protein